MAKERKQLDREYYLRHKEEIREKRNRAYQGEIRDKAIERSRKRYAENPEKVLLDNKLRKQARRKRIGEIAIYYGCQNPNCKWFCGFLPCQLQFHHLTPAEKEASISSMAGWSDENVAQEINKCCVLCACCHMAVKFGGTSYDGPPCLVNESLEIQE